MLCTVPIITIAGYLLIHSRSILVCTRSLAVLIHLSASGMCSLAVYVLSLIPINVSGTRICSKCTSISDLFTLKLLLPNINNIFFSNFNMRDVLIYGSHSPVNIFIFQETETIKANFVMCITFTFILMFLWLFTGKLSLWETRLDLDWIICPFMAGTLGSKISSVILMFWAIMGQFKIPLHDILKLSGGCKL